MKVLVFLAFLVLIPSVVDGGQCGYWNSLVDPKAPQASLKESEKASKDIMSGIECLLKLEGRKSQGVRYGQKSFVSQTVPKASVETNALYQISELFYGNDDFAYAVALTADPPKIVGELEVEEYNAPEVVKIAFASYRIWFKEVEKIGLDAARAKKLDPLAGSGVIWVGP
jgi:hypothetical protein